MLRHGILASEINQYTIKKDIKKKALWNNP